MKTTLTWTGMRLSGNSFSLMDILSSSKRLTLYSSVLYFFLTEFSVLYLSICYKFAAN